MPHSSKHLSEVARVFFKMGCYSFGGPAAHIAMMEEEVVNKRKWIDRQHFLDLVGATNLIPGPNSTEMTMHCGHERAGTTGLFVAGFCFVFPAVLITGIFAWLYAEFGQLPQVEPFIIGIKPAVLSIIIGAILKLGKKALKGLEYGILGSGVLAVSLAGVNEITALLGAGLVGAVYFYFKNSSSKNSLAFSPFLLVQLPVILPKIGSLSIFWTFLKVGAVLYGSGYVLFAYLDAEVVQRGWLTTQQLIDAVAVGQFTPGPVLSTATFVGYQMGGLTGAMAATLGIFLPSFLFVWLLNPLVPKMRKSRLLAGFLDSVNIAAVAVMISVLLEMAKVSVTDWRTVTIALLGLIFTFGPKKLSAMWLVLGGAVLGYLLFLI